MKTPLSGWKTRGKFGLFLAVVLCCAGLPVLAQSVAPIQLTDDFANRPALLPDDWIAGSLSNATLEAGEPLVSDVSSGQTAWGTWTALSNGIASLSIEAQTFSPLLTIYAGTAFDNLSLVASNNYLICYSDGYCGCHWRERQQITFHVAHGQAYQFCLDSAIITDASIQLLSTPDNGGGQMLWWGPLFTTNILAGGDFTLNFTVPLTVTPAGGYSAAPRLGLPP